MSTIENPTFLRKRMPLRGFSLSRDECVELYRLLQSLAAEAADLEVAQYTLQPNQTPEQIEQNKAAARALFLTYVQIETAVGATISQGSENILRPPEFPTGISKIEMDTGNIFRVRLNVDPLNRAYVLLDFRTVGSSGMIVLPAQETPNDSCIIVYGRNSNWVRAAYSKLEDFFADKKRAGMWIHGAAAYDMLLMTAGILFLAWIMNFSVPHIDAWFAGYSKIYNYSGYIFVFLLALRFFMFMFQYARMLWPVGELKDGSRVTASHRFIWITLLLGVIAGIITNLFF